MADTDPSSIFQWFLSLLGFSSGAGALTKTVLSQSAVQARLKKLEDDRDGHTLKIDAINERTVRLDERTEHISDKVVDIGSDVKEILRSLRKRED